jgi:tRNA (cmo5U34)-methyltransferase
MADWWAASSSRSDPEVGSGIRAPEGVWTFGDKTPLAFEEHVMRSIPGYHECHELILDLADQLCPAEGRCYDLGCSTGALTRKLSERLGPRGVEVIGIDRDPGMIEHASQVQPATSSPRFIVSAVEQMEFQRADLIVSFYTLQFVPLRHRQALLTRLRHALEPCGTLVLFEKTLSPTGTEQDIADGVYLEFKRRQGFTNSEIVEKRRSLRGILQPLPVSQNYSLLRDAGFTQITHVFRWMTFDGVIARSDAT